MMNKNTTARAYGICIATTFAILVTFVFHSFWRDMPGLLVVLIFIGFWLGFFVTGLWIFNREFPISGAERRRRNKQFYDWLRSQRRG
jgi:hypothetical protein